MFGIRGRKLCVETLEARHLLAVTIVDTHFDTVDPNDGLTSLREAVVDSNLDPDADEIRFAPWLEGQTLRLVQGELTITGELSLVGPGADLLTIDASGNDPTPGTNNGDGSRVFYIGNGDPDLAPQVKISGVTLTGGDVDGDGGAIWAEPFEFEGFATGTMTFADIELAARGGVDFSLSQRESTGTLQLLAGSFEITTTPDGAAAGAVGNTGSGVDIMIIDADDDSDTLHSAVYDAGTNEIVITGDFNGNGGFSSIRIIDLADAIANIETSPGISDFAIGHVANAANFVTAADVRTYADVLTGGLAASTGETIEITAADGVTADISLAFVEQAGVGATPIVNGNAIDGYTVAIDSGNTETTLADIASAIQSIDEVDTAITTSARSFNGSLDNTPAALTNLTGARAAGVDTITITAEFPGPALNRNLVFNTSNAEAGGISIDDDGTVLTLSIDSTSQYQLSDLAAAIDSLASFNAELTGDGSGTYEADDPTDDTDPLLANVAGGLNPADGSAANALPKPLILDGVLISDNHALGSGGGVYGSGSVKVASSTIAGNLASAIGTASAYGGGIYSVGFTTVENSTVSDNTTTAMLARGGGIFSAGSLRIVQSTIVNNRAIGSTAIGGGVNATSQPLHISGSIVTGNFATAAMPDVATTTLDANYSIFGALPAVTLSGTAIQIGIDPQLTLLGDYGGPTPTHFLLDASPAVDAGDPTLAAGLTTAAYDQRGDGFSRVTSGRIDIGAVELPATFGDIDSDRIVTGSDFLAWQRTANSELTILDLFAWQAAYRQGSTSVAAVIADSPMNLLFSEPLTLTSAAGFADTVGENNNDPVVQDEAFAEYAPKLAVELPPLPAAIVALSDFEAPTEQYDADYLADRFALAYDLLEVSFV